MGVLNGQPVDQTVTNAAFLNKNQDDTMANKLSFARALSGPTVDDIQLAINNLYTATGVTEAGGGTTYDAPTDTIDNGDTYETALSKLAHKFHPATGHLHTGADGDGPLLEVVRTIAASGFMSAFGDVTLIAGTGISLTQINEEITITSSVMGTTIAASGNPALNGDVVLVAGPGMQLSQSGQNITISATGGSGGGGGGSLQWVEGLNTPLPSVEYGSQIYSYGAGLDQSLSASIKVPDSYIAGNLISLLGLVYSAATGDDLLFQTITTLIRPGTDPISDTTNQHTSTNSAISLSGATQEVPQAVVFDLTDGSGEINSVGVSPGDLLLVNLTRGTDTSTEDGKVIVYASEIKFV